MTLNVKYVSVVCATVVISASQGVHVANAKIQWTTFTTAQSIYLGITSKVQCFNVG